MSRIDAAELSALVAQVEELARRFAEVGERAQGGPDDDAARPLFEAERSLQVAARALDRAMGFQGSSGGR